MTKQYIYNKSTEIVRVIYTFAVLQQANILYYCAAVVQSLYIFSTTLDQAPSWENIDKDKTCFQKCAVYLGQFYDVNLTNDKPSVIYISIMKGLLCGEYCFD